MTAARGHSPCERVEGELHAWPGRARLIERLAPLSSDDVVLEIGPGRGILTRFLAARVGHVHAVEIDRSLPGQAVLRLAPSVADMTYGMLRSYILPSDGAEPDPKEPQRAFAEAAIARWERILAQEQQQ